MSYLEDFTGLDNEAKLRILASDFHSHKVGNDKTHDRIRVELEKAKDGVVKLDKDVALMKKELSDYKEFVTESIDRISSQVEMLPRIVGGIVIVGVFVLTAIGIGMTVIN